MPTAFNLDLLRASLGRELTGPYEATFGAVPWLTAGTLSWPARYAERVLHAWLEWSPGTLTAVRLGAAEVAVDVAVLGDPSGVPTRLAALRDLGPAQDSVALVGPQSLRAPAFVAATGLGLRTAPEPAVLLDAARAMPEGVCLGLRHDLALIGVTAAGELPRALAAVDQAARALEGIAVRSAG